LGKYYEGEGSRDPVVIELPKGGYTLRFRLREKRAPADHKKRWSVPQLVVALAGLTAAIAVLAWWWVQHGSKPIAIAVLPLENVTHDPANDYFADGLTDELIRNLAIIDGLVVRSRTSSFAFRGKPQSVREAGKQLEADYILEGSVLRAGQQLRINAQLVRVSDDFPLWSGKFDRELTDVFAIQEEISRGIVNSLRLKLGHGRRRYETSTEAYDLYLRGRALGEDHSIGPFEEAIAKDPSFAPAYAGLAAAHAVRSGIFEFDSSDELAKMRTAALKAIQLDPLLAEAHMALGLVYARGGQWEASEKSFRRAIELDPSLSESYDRFARGLLLPLGRIEEALQQARVAAKTDPLSVEVQSVLAWMLISAGRYDEAAQYCQKLPAQYWYKSECLGRARLGQGRTGEAIHVLEASNRPVDRRYRGYAYGKAGRREEAEKLAAAVAPNPFSEALIFAGLGDKDRTLEALDRVAQLGPVRIGRALNSPEFALLRGDPRVKALRKKVGLPE
jgi:TolB-like protein/Tfp pilus assembly protein PilF